MKRRGMVESIHEEVKSYRIDWFNESIRQVG